MKGDFPISIYVDVNGQWVSGKKDSHIKWTHWENNSSDDNLHFRTWRIQKAEDEVFTEHKDRAEWGKLYFNGPGVRKFADKLQWIYIILTLRHRAQDLKLDGQTL